MAKSRGKKPTKRSPTKKKPSKKKPERKPVKGFEVDLIECGKPTSKGNVYPPEVMANAISGFNNREQRWVTMPKDNIPRVRLKDVVGKAKLSIFEDRVTAHIELMDTDTGKQLLKYLEEGKVRFSPRGVGTISEDGIVQEGYRLDCIVAELIDDGEDEEDKTD